jgi:gamma-glutamyltranspeptidase
VFANDAEAMADAIGYAEHGYSVLPGMAAAIEQVADLFR